MFQCGYGNNQVVTVFMDFVGVDGRKDTTDHLRNTVLPGVFIELFNGHFQNIHTVYLTFPILKMLRYRHRISAYAAS